MKKIVVLLILTMLCLWILPGCHRGGDVEEVRKSIGPSEVYSSQDIDQALEQVLQHFQKNFTGCTLLEVTYEEESVRKACLEWARQYDQDQAIVFTSTFRTGSSGGDGSLNPNQTYQGWGWVLTRDLGGAWTLQTWGYG